MANPKLDVKMPYEKGKGGDGMLELAGEHEVAHATRQNQVITDHQANEKDATKQGMQMMKNGNSPNKGTPEDCPTCRMR